MIDKNSVLGVKNNTQKTGEPQFATVAQVYEDGVTLILDGETEPTQKHYLTNCDTAFAVGDRVKILRDSSTYVVEYKVGPPKRSDAVNWSIWGHAGTYLTFFGGSVGRGKITVPNLSGSVTISDVGNRLNDLLNALRLYNLIG